MIVGRPQSGTSTLVAELLRAGASYYSDQYAVLDREGRIILSHGRCGYAPARGQIRHGIGPKNCGRRPEHNPCRLDSSCFPTIGKSRPLLAPITASAAAAEVIANTVCAKR